MMERLLISLPDKLFSLLKDEKKKTGASFAEIVRRALERYLIK